MKVLVNFEITKDEEEYVYLALKVRRYHPETILAILRGDLPCPTWLKDTLIDKWTRGKENRLMTTREEIPQFASEDDEREFWATHDSTDYADTATPVVLEYDKRDTMTKQEKIKEEVAKLDYKWRFCGIPDEYEKEWEKETECIKQSCRGFATALLKLLHPLGAVLIDKEKKMATKQEEIRDGIAELYWLKYRDACQYSCYWEMDWATLVSEDNDKLGQRYVEACREFASQIMLKEDSQGVVLIDKDRELPETPYNSIGELPDEFNSDETSTDMDVFLMHCNGIEKGKSLMLRAGFKATMPLIKEDEDGNN